MPLSIALLGLADLIPSLGRGIVCYAPRWSPETGAALELTHLGHTEGNISFNINAETAGLTLPELTGPAMHAADFVGENPTLEIPLYLADPALIAVVSPAGSAHGGKSRRGQVAEYTVAVFPEELWGVPEDGEAPPALTFAAGAWALDGAPLTAEQETLLAASIWLWRGFFNKPPRRFLGGAGDARKNIETVSFQVMHHAGMPEGHALYTSGDPALQAIDIEGGS